MAAGVAYMAVMAAVSILQGMSGSRQAKRAAQATVDAAVAAQQADVQALATRNEQIADATALQQFERKRQGTRERSMLAAAAAGSGVTDNQDRAAITSKLQEDFDIGITSAQAESASVQTSNEFAGVTARARGRINRARVNIPTRTQQGLNIISAGVQGAQAGQQLYLNTR